MNNEPFKYSPSVWIVPALLSLFIWIIFLIDQFFNFDLNKYGIVPRTAIGFFGVFFSPFLHNDLNHIANNTLPLFILSMALVYFYRDLSLKVLFWGILVSGFCTWVIGRSGNHIGASGLIYVLFSFLFFKGFITKYYRLMALSFTIVLVYGGMIWYVFPQPDIAGVSQNVSWEGHLSGLVTGCVFAILYKTPVYVADRKYAWQHPDYDAGQDDFMKHFDQNGHFAPKPIEEPATDDQDGTPLIVYHLKSN